MSIGRRSQTSRRGAERELTRLRSRLTEVEEALRAIRGGEVDAVVVASAHGPQVFTLEGAGHAYRTLIESMNEGALTLTSRAVILYANQCFARMVRRPLQQVIGGSLHRFLPAADQIALRIHLKHGGRSGSKILVHLLAADGSQMPVQVSIRLLPGNGVDRAATGIVVTDMTEAARAEELLRALARRVVQVQETERARVALELHDNITQLLCAVLFRSQALAESISAKDAAQKRAAQRLREMLGTTAEEVERISHDLRPGILHQLGLVAILRATGIEFATRTGIAVKVTCARLATRLHADTELALYRILQHALKNVELHAHAGRVAVALTLRAAVVQLKIKDDGLGFDPDRRSSSRTKMPGVGLLEMRERAVSLGGVLNVTSAVRGGTEIEVRIPVPSPSKRKPPGVM